MTSVFQHYNPTGPGQYELPGENGINTLFGKRVTTDNRLIFNSNIITKPSFSFGPRRPSNIKIKKIEDKPALDQTPGVGCYDWAKSKDSIQLKQSFHAAAIVENGTPKWTPAMMGKGERFPETSCATDFKVTVPVSYEGIDSVTSMSRNRSSIMTSKTSLKLEALKARDTMLIRGDLTDAYESPGPAAYAQKLLTQ